MSTVEKLSLAESHRDVILDLIRIVLPVQNNLPTSYNQIKKSIKTPTLSEFLLCKICCKEIKQNKKDKRKNKICSTELCLSRTSGLKSNNFIKVFSSDIIAQIQMILSKHLDTMINYKRKFK